MSHRSRERSERSASRMDFGPRARFHWGKVIQKASSSGRDLIDEHSLIDGHPDDSERLARGEKFFAIGEMFDVMRPKVLSVNLITKDIKVGNVRVPVAHGIGDALHEDEVRVPATHRELHEDVRDKTFLEFD